MRFYFWLARKLLFSKQIMFGGSAPLSFLGLVLGVASLVVSMAVFNGYIDTLKTAMTDVTAHLQVVKRGRLNTNWEKFSAELREAEPRIQNLMRFAYAEAVMARQGQVSGVLMQGVDAGEIKEVLRFEKRLKSGQIQLNDNGIVIGAGLAKKYKLGVGEKVYLVVPLATPFEGVGFKRQSQEFTVSGIIDFGKNDWNERLVLSDLKSLQKLTEIGDRYTGVFIRLENADLADEAADRLLENLGPAYSITTWYDVNRNMFEAVVIERAVIFFVVLLIVIVAAFNISSTLYVFMRQKYADIAILKTLGLSPRKIRLILMSQGFMIGLLGTVVGIILGYDLCFAFMYLQDHYALISGSVYKVDKIYTDVRVLDLLIIAGTTQLICLAATYFPAYRGSRLEVIEGLRNG